MPANGKTEQPDILLSTDDFLSRLRHAAITGLKAGAVLYAMAYLGAPLWSAAVVGLVFAGLLALQFSSVRKFHPLEQPRTEPTQRDPMARSVISPTVWRQRSLVRMGWGLLAVATLLMALLWTSSFLRTEVVAGVGLAAVFSFILVLIRYLSITDIIIIWLVSMLVSWTIKIVVQCLPIVLKASATWSELWGQ